jgi:hypothetical protein
MVGVVAAIVLATAPVMVRLAIEHIIEVADRLIHRRARRREPSIPGA